jgi:hypothetical protein
MLDQARLQAAAQDLARMDELGTAHFQSLRERTWSV